ncbi:MAG: hypothetical protein JOS17DRAFT_797491 [Linnemannia elongata]|nr:MAG: hypothetical protein JOS17DRAFT_797491 [Linnemannia elongata]
MAPLNQHRLYCDLRWDTRWPAVLRIPDANRIRLGGALQVGSWHQIAHFLAAPKRAGDPMYLLDIPWGKKSDLGLLTVRFPSKLTSLKLDIRQPFTIQMECLI